MSALRLSLCALAFAACEVGPVPLALDAGDDPTGPDATNGSDDAADTADPDGGVPTDAADPCQPIEGVTYRTLSTVGPITDRPAAVHADINVKLRGWGSSSASLGLVDINGPTDSLAPQLDTMFTDDRAPTFTANHRVNNWDWSTNSAAGPITDWEVTLTSAQTTPGEIIEAPDSGYDIGEGMDVRVLYADEDSITLKYTREDNMVGGYGVHILGICVEPTLLSLYQASNNAGRGELPALAGNQPLGRARAAAIRFGIRDTGAFMEPRSRKDWWKNH